jgi:hypothetical protein
MDHRPPNRRVIYTTDEGSLIRETPVKPEPLPTAERIAEWSDQLLANDRVASRLFELRRWTRVAMSALGLGFDGKRVVFPIRDGSGELVNVCRYTPSPGENEPKMISLLRRPRDLETIERTDPAEQEKIIKFNTLLTNCVIFYTALDMTAGQEQVSGHRLPKARGQRREAAAVGAEDRVLLARKLAQALARHTAVVESGEETMRGDLALDVGQVAACHFHQLVGARMTRTVGHSPSDYGNTRGADRQRLVLAHSTRRIQKGRWSCPVFDDT